MTGQLGWSAAGLAAQERNEGERFKRLIEAHHHPTPLYAAGPSAARKGATSLIDVSDGLVADLMHIAGPSGVRIDLDSTTLIPDDELRVAGEAIGIDPRIWVLTGGEDHAFVATFPDGTVPPSWKAIGRVTEGSPAVTVDGARWTKTDGGFDHFNDWTAR
jgi:thiamine-monophosphate kinase